MRIASCVLVINAMLLVACAGAPIVVNGVKTHEGKWNQIKQDLGARAAFDLACPREQLEFTPLTIKPHLYDIGVRGCGNQARYHKLGGMWLMDNGQTSQAPSS